MISFSVRSSPFAVFLGAGCPANCELRTANCELTNGH